VLIRDRTWNGRWIRRATLVRLQLGHVKNCVRRMVNDEEIFTKFVWIDNAKHILRDTGPVACLPKIICLLSSDGSSTRMTAVRSLVTSSKRRTRQRMDFTATTRQGIVTFFWLFRLITGSSAVAERPRDALCLSVVSLNQIITRADSFIIVTN